MLFREFVDSVQSIIAVADLVKNNSKDGTASMADFLYSLSNAGISMDYDKFKSVYDSEPELKNVIQQFDAENITFVGGKPDADAPVGDVPPEEKVGQMAKRAMNKREESILPEAYGSQHLAAVAKQFDELKDANEHGKAAQLLVQTFGNELEQKLIKTINDVEAARGSIKDEEQNIRDHITSKYYKVLQNELAIQQGISRKITGERKLTKPEKSKMKKYEKSLPDADFKERYGARWKEVKYATATKMAKKNA